MSSPFATLGCVAAVYDWAWPEAERQYRRAIELNPEHPAAHHWYAINYLVPLKRFEEADTELRRAVGADPLSMPIRVSLGLRSYFAHRYAQARDELRGSFELDAGSATARLFLGLTLVEMGSFDEAVPELETALQVARSPEMIAALGYAFARAGHIDRARQALGELMTFAGSAIHLIVAHRAGARRPRRTAPGVRLARKGAGRSRRGPRLAARSSGVRQPPVGDALPRAAGTARALAQR